MLELSGTRSGAQTELMDMTQTAINQIAKKQKHNSEQRQMATKQHTPGVRKRHQTQPCIAIISGRGRVDIQTSNSTAPCCADIQLLSLIFKELVMAPSQ